MARSSRTRRIQLSDEELKLVEELRKRKAILAEGLDIARAIIEDLNEAHKANPDVEISVYHLTLLRHLNEKKKDLLDVRK